MKFEPGDILVNTWLDVDNPFRKAVIYKITRKSYYLANLQGDTWRITKKNDHIKKVGELHLFPPGRYYEKEK